MHSRVKTEHRYQRYQKQHRPKGGDFTEMMVPKIGQQQRAECDGEQDEGKRQAPKEAEFLTVKIGGAGCGGQQQGEADKVWSHGSVPSFSCGEHVRPSENKRPIRIRDGLGSAGTVRLIVKEKKHRFQQDTGSGAGGNGGR